MLVKRKANTHHQVISFRQSLFLLYFCLMSFCSVCSSSTASSFFFSVISFLFTFLSNLLFSFLVFPLSYIIFIFVLLDHKLYIKYFLMFHCFGPISNTTTDTGLPYFQFFKKKYLRSSIL